MISVKHAYEYCKDYTKIENYNEALMDNKHWECHHRKEIDEHKTTEQLIKEKLYYSRPPEELIFLPVDEHKRLHSLNMSVEHKQKISNSHKGIQLSEEHKKKLSEIKKLKPSFKGKKHSEESKELMRQKRKEYYLKKKTLA